MTHFVCTGTCRGESERSGVCEAKNCTKESQPLAACNCTDGKHAEVLLAPEPGYAQGQ